MGDKSASHDAGENEVHPGGRAEATLVDFLQDDADSLNGGGGDVAGVGGSGNDEGGHGSMVHRTGSAVNVVGEDGAATAVTGERDDSGAEQGNAEGEGEGESESEGEVEGEGDEDGAGFDPDTLANLAALSRIGAEGEEGTESEWRIGGEGMTREQVQEIVENLQAARRGEKEPEPAVEQRPPQRHRRNGQTDDTDRDAAEDVRAGADGNGMENEEQHGGKESDSVVEARDRDDAEAGHPGHGHGHGQGQGHGHGHGHGHGRGGDRHGERERTAPNEKEKEEGEGESEGEGDSDAGEESDGQSDEDRVDGGAGDGGEYRDPRYRFEDGKMKRKRNRSTLSCTECKRRKQQCDRNIPCTRCIKRGIPSMCRMDAIPVPQTTHVPRKRRRLVNDVPINYELGLRVQALESLIRSGSNMEADAASSAAMETILQATRAANSGSQDAASALAQLTQNSVAGMSQDAQNGLLMDVLQQLSVASMGTSTPRPIPEGSEDDIWSTVPLIAADTLSAIASAHENDEATDKLNVALPGFREDTGQIFVPPTVRYAEKLLRQEEMLSKDALPIEGDQRFLDACIRFAYGAESVPYTNKRISAIQAISHTGALRIAASFLSRIPSATSPKTIYVPDPTDSEDILALRDSGVDIRHYRFLDRKTGAVDWEGMRDDLQAAPSGSPILFHISGSTPTGAELTAPQWRLLTALLETRRHIPVISLAFQGLASGDPGRDAQPLRFMVHEGLPVVLIQSFDAMMGLYADSPAVVSVVTSSTAIRDKVDSQLRHSARAIYTHPSAVAARIVHMILTDAKLYPAWLNEIKAMSDRLRSVREKIYDLLVNRLKTPGSWHHIKRASGMYCTTLLNPHLVEMLASERHIHLLPSGAFSLGCLNASKIDTLVRAVDHVVREGIREAEEEAAQRVAMELALAAAKEAAAREEAEAQAARELAEAEAALAEDTLLMERSIANAMEAQQRAEEEEERTLDEQRRLDDAVRRAAERAEIARQAEAILASIQTNG